jgi:hypothetical protein
MCVIFLGAVLPRPAPETDGEKEVVVLAFSQRFEGDVAGGEILAEPVVGELLFEDVAVS